MLSDPIADMLTRIRNANQRGHRKVELPHSKLKEGIADVLKKEGYITDYKVIPDELLGEKKKILYIYLKYGPDNTRVINQMVRISKPGRRIFKKVKELRPVMDGLGIAILSTSKGIMTDQQAKELGIGGEVICEVW
jgi:small subunit ribosomal protein S8